MQTFSKGQKSKLADLTPQQQLTVGVGMTGQGGEAYDVSCFGLDAQGKLSDDRYFVFYNQTATPEGAIALASSPMPGDNATFTVDLSRIPAQVHRLVFTAALDGHQTMATLRQGHFRITAGGSEAMRYDFTGADFSSEKAVMVGEIYMKDVWRTAAVGQGFAGGLSALLVHFGGEEAGAAPAPASPPPASPPPASPPPASPPPASPPPASPPPAAPPPAAAAPVNLGKVTLDKRGESRSVSLRKDGGQQPIHVNLNWNQQAPQKRGFLSGRGSEAPDLDLGCMFEMRDGSKGVIQPLGGNFGDRSGPPFIYLDKDDRTGASSDGENLYILRPDLITRVMVFAMVYEGATDFGSVGGRLGMRDQQGNETLMHLNSPDANRTFCSIAMVTQDGSNVVITKEERYFRGHKDADEFYRFGFRWKAGSK